MTSEQYAYWLQGFVELNGGRIPTEAQWKSIVEHLSTVFVKITLPVGNDTYCFNDFNKGKPDQKRCSQDSFSSHAGYVIPKVDLSSIPHTC